MLFIDKVRMTQLNQSIHSWLVCCKQQLQRDVFITILINVFVLRSDYRIHADMKLINDSAFSLASILL